MKRRTQGFTLVEMLVAMALLGTVLALAYGGIYAGTRQQRTQEALTTTQAKLRRVLEVVTQDVRGAMFGSISDKPYTSGSNALSFTMLVGGAGYQVLPQNTTNTVVAGSLVTISPNVNVAPDLANSQVMLINGDGLGVLFRAGALTRQAITNEWQVTFPSCGSVPYTNNTLLFKVNSFGYRLDSATRILYYRSGENAEQPLAYDITEFSLTYIYLNRATGAIVERPTPERANGNPQKVLPISGAEHTLSQIKIKLGTLQRTFGRTIERKYETAIDLGATQTLQVKTVRSCS